MKFLLPLVFSILLGSLTSRAESAGLGWCYFTTDCFGVTVGSIELDYNSCVGAYGGKSWDDGMTCYSADHSSSDKKTEQGTENESEDEPR